MSPKTRIISVSIMFTVFINNNCICVQGKSTKILENVLHFLLQLGDGGVGGFHAVCHLLE
jgi:hypothetical protein